MPRSGKKKSPAPVPFSFVFDYLYPKEPVIKPMFGCHALYLGKTIYLILRKRTTHKSINGVWIATKREHHESLQREIRSMRSIHVLGKEPTNWQVIPESGAEFEADVITACALVRKGDPRIGVVPKKRRKG